MKKKVFTSYLRKPPNNMSAPPVSLMKDMELRFYIDNLEWHNSLDDEHPVYMDEVGIIGNRAGLLYLAKHLISIAYMDDPEDVVIFFTHRTNLNKDSQPACIRRVESLSDLADTNEDLWPPKRKEYKRPRKR